MQALIGVLIDIAAATVAIHALPGAASGIALMLLFNVGAAALFLPLRTGIAIGRVRGRRADPRIPVERGRRRALRRGSRPSC